MRRRADDRGGARPAARPPVDPGAFEAAAPGSTSAGGRGRSRATTSPTSRNGALPASAVRGKVVVVGMTRRPSRTCTHADGQRRADVRARRSRPTRCGRSCTSCRCAPRPAGRACWRSSCSAVAAAPAALRLARVARSGAGARARLPRRRVLGVPRTAGCCRSSLRSPPGGQRRRHGRRLLRDRDGGCAAASTSRTRCSSGCTPAHGRADETSSRSSAAWPAPPSGATRTPARTSSASA